MPCWKNCYHRILSSLLSKIICHFDSSSKLQSSLYCEKNKYGSKFIADLSVSCNIQSEVRNEVCSVNTDLDFGIPIDISLREHSYMTSDFTK